MKSKMLQGVLGLRKEAVMCNNACMESGCDNSETIYCFHLFYTDEARVRTDELNYSLA